MLRKSTLPNKLSCLRGLLAFCFLTESVAIRMVGIILAIITDILDGFLARRWKTTTLLGNLLDPIMDKVFVFFCLAVLISEKRITHLELASLLSRDLALVLFAVYLTINNCWKYYKIQSFVSGKIFTSLQFITLLLLILQIDVPVYIYYFFIVLMFCAIIELYKRRQQSTTLF
jgi:CDP-diacylglycerol---glycerol-3-phosphate 3-phosphatidyltransferase